MVRLRAKIEKNTLFGRALVRIVGKIEKKNTLISRALGKKTVKHVCCRAFVRIRAKIEKTLCDRALVRVRAIIEKKNFLVGLWLEYGQESGKSPFWLE